MLNSVNIELVLTAFVGLQLAISLSCYSCNSSDNCHNKAMRNCSQEMSLRTSELLSFVYSNVPEIIVDQNLDCVHTTYEVPLNYSKSNVILGCKFREINACNLTLKSGQRPSSCFTWSAESYLDNPAASSGKNAYVILTSGVLLLVAKLLTL